MSGQNNGISEAQNHISESVAKFGFRFRFEEPTKRTVDPSLKLDFHFHFRKERKWGLRVQVACGVDDAFGAYVQLSLGHNPDQVPESRRYNRFAPWSSHLVGLKW
jgi:hypothetical protein